MLTVEHKLTSVLNAESPLEENITAAHVVTVGIERVQTLQLIKTLSSSCEHMHTYLVTSSLDSLLLSCPGWTGWGRNLGFPFLSFVGCSWR